MDIVRHLKTNTTKFILPLLFDEGVNRRGQDVREYDEGVKHDDILTKDFKDTYITDIDKQEVDDYILLEYDILFEEYSLELLDNYIVDTYDNNDGNIIFCLKLPDKFLDDYHKFLSGQYSQLSKEAKIRILEFWGANESTLLHGILYKTNVGRKFWEDKLNSTSDKWSIDAEYWFSPNMKREILGFEPITIT